MAVNLFVSRSAKSTCDLSEQANDFNVTRNRNHQVGKTMSKKCIGVGYAHRNYLPKTSGPQDTINVHADLGVAPKVKKAFTERPEIHSGMMAKSKRTGEHFAGLGGQDLSRFDGDPGMDALGGAPRGKVLTPPTPAFGQRSRQTESAFPVLPPGVNNKLHRGAGVDHQLARRIFGEATSSADDRLALAHYGIGKLPDETTGD
jgi:hypothetical protein